MALPRQSQFTIQPFFNTKPETISPIDPALTIYTLVLPPLVWIMAARNSIPQQEASGQHFVMLRTSGAGRNICASHCSGCTSSARFFLQYQMAAL